MRAEMIESLKKFHADYLPKHPELGESRAAPARPLDPQEKPNPGDLYFMFPGLKTLDEKQAMDFLFGISK